MTAPRVLARFHAVATIVWIVAIPVSVLTGLRDSVPFLVFLSLWALVSGHWAAWQAARAELAQDAD
jgi:hypothetical protein